MKNTQKKFQHFENLIKEELENILSEDALEYYSPKFMAPEEEAAFLKDYPKALKKYNEAWDNREKLHDELMKRPGINDSWEKAVPKNYKIGRDLYYVLLNYIVKIKKKRPANDTQGIWTNAGRRYAVAFLQYRTSSTKAAKARPVNFSAYFNAAAAAHRDKYNWNGKQTLADYMSEGGFEKGKDWEEYSATPAELTAADWNGVARIADKIWRQAPSDSPWREYYSSTSQLWKEKKALDTLFRSKTARLKQADIIYTRDKDTLELIPGKGASGYAAAKELDATRKDAESGMAQMAAYQQMRKDAEEGQAQMAAAYKSAGGSTSSSRVTDKSKGNDQMGNNDTEKGDDQMGDNDEDDTQTGGESGTTTATTTQQTGTTPPIKKSKTKKTKTAPRGTTGSGGTPTKTKFSLSQFEADDPKMQKDVGNLMLKLQKRLSKLRLYKGEEDSVFGRGTASALRKAYFVNQQ